MAILRIRIRGGNGGARVVDDGVVAVTREKCRIEVVSDEWGRTSGDGSCYVAVYL